MEGDIVFKIFEVKFVREKIEEELNKIKPALQAEGGDVELVDVKEGVVKVRLQGTCAGCPFSQLTVKNYIEALLKKNVEGVKRVEAV